MFFDQKITLCRTANRITRRGSTRQLECARATTTDRKATKWWGSHLLVEWNSLEKFRVNWRSFRRFSDFSSRKSIKTQNPKLLERQYFVFPLNIFKFYDGQINWTPSGIVLWMQWCFQILLRTSNHYRGPKAPKSVTNTRRSRGICYLALSSKFTFNNFVFQFTFTIIKKIKIWVSHKTPQTRQRFIISLKEGEGAFNFGGEESIRNLIDTSYIQGRILTF